MSQALVATITLFLLTACSVHNASTPNDMRGFHAEPADPPTIHFEPGRPRVTDRFEDSLASNSSLEDLHENLAHLAKGPTGFVFQINGHTDDAECGGDACIDLSMRRANGFTKWLVDHGFPRDRLASPMGYGNSRPLEAKVTDENRLRNRRVEIDIARVSR